MRIVDLIAPIGKGTRQLIVSPPKAGKTVLLEQIVLAIRQCSPKSRVIVLLVDERPEEVTHFSRSVEGAEVVSSTSDHTADEHTELCELILAHVQTELECGREVVLLIDSLTRMGRAFNNRTRGRGRRRATMSGGLEAGILEIPRRLFGLARTVENGGGHHHYRHVPDQYRLAHGPAHLRRVQRDGQQRNHPGPVSGRSEGLPRHRYPGQRHAKRGRSLQRSP